MRDERVLPRNRLAGIGDEAAAGLDGQIAAIHRLGWSALELRTVDGTALADLGTSAFRTAADRLRGEGIDVVCLASRIGNWARPVTGPFEDDIAELETLAERCAELRCRYVRIMSYPNDGLADDDWAARVIDRIARLTDRAERAGVTLVHENCAGWAGDSAERMLRLLREVGSPSLRLLFDTGNGVPHGYDALDILRKTVPYVAHVHIKDAIGTAEETEYTLPGDGRAQVAECLRLLADSGYSGSLSLEPHLAVRPHEALRARGENDTALFVRAGQRLAGLLAETAPRGPGRGTAAPAGGGARG